MIIIYKDSRKVATVRQEEDGTFHFCSLQSLDLAGPVPSEGCYFPDFAAMSAFVDDWRDTRPALHVHDHLQRGLRQEH